MNLANKRIVVTRPRAQAAELSGRLRALGAVPIEMPAIRIAPPADEYDALDYALHHLPLYDWVVFTSTNGVDHFWQRVAALDITPLWSIVKVAAIGSATAAALRERGVSAQLVPDEFVAESLLDALRERDIAGKHFLLPRADIARAALREGLEQAGAKVDEVHAYRTLPGEPDTAALAELERGVDALTFTSSSTVRHWVAQVGAARAQAVAARSVVAAIGPITARTAAELGLTAQVVAREYTIPGLVEALVRHWQGAGEPLLSFAPLQAAEARQIAAWRYAAPYDFYNPSDDLEEEVRYFTDPANQLFALYDARGELLGYCSFGGDAQVQGFTYDDAALDVGIGLHPDRAGQGRGAATLRAVLGFGRARFAPRRFRATIAAWNERALRAAEHAGFRRVATFSNNRGDWVVLLTDA